MMLFIITLILITTLGWGFYWWGYQKGHEYGLEQSRYDGYPIDGNESKCDTELKKANV